MAPRIYFPIYQRSGNAFTLFFRATLDPRSLQTAIEQSVHGVDPTLPVYGQRTMTQLLADSEVRRKFVLSLMNAFALVALLLAALGTYGVMTFAAGQRVREIGIRMALGAEPANIVRLMLAPGLLLAGIGIIVGIISALFLTRLMATLLFSVSPADVSTYAAISALLITVTLVACWLPARRAMRVDPIVALRHE